MQATSKTIIRMWNKDGYHKDVAIINSDQVVMTENRVQETSLLMSCSTEGAPSLVINPADFPEAVCFQIIVQEYRR